MAVSGLILVAFITAHLLGNLQIFGSPDHINGYAHFLQSLGPVLWLTRGILLVALAVHVWAAVVLTLENRRARGRDNYAVHRVIQATLASRTMRWTGAIVFFFILYHLAQFTLGIASHDHFKTAIPAWTMLGDAHEFGVPIVAKGAQVADVYSMVFLGFANPVVSIFYIVAIGLLSLHLAHGIESLFQTIGWRNHSWAGGLRKVARLFCLLYFLGNLAIPGAIVTGLLKPAPGTYAAQKLDASASTSAAADSAQR